MEPSTVVPIEKLSIGRLGIRLEYFIEKEAEQKIKRVNALHTHQKFQVWYRSNRHISLPGRGRFRLTFRTRTAISCEENKQ